MSVQHEPTYVAAARLSRADYERMLLELSRASVDSHFLPFRDIAWDDPAFALQPDHDGWVLGTEDNIGASAWYRSLPVDRQREIGRYRLAQICNVGRQFEQMLVAGMMTNHLWMDTSNPEFRYATHEATEETHHMQMFGEAIRRMQPDVAGMPRWLKALTPLICLVAAIWPTAFWIMVLAGEEPIDHLQKSALRAEHAQHPLPRRVMQIHVAEEARHIGFAHQYLTQRGPGLGVVSRFVLALATPVIMRLACDAIMKPTPAARRAMGMPRSVARHLWWRSPETRAHLADYFAEVRMLADSIGLRPRWVHPLWRLLRIEGRPARFRGEAPSDLT